MWGSPLSGGQEQRAICIPAARVRTIKPFPLQSISLQPGSAAHQWDVQLHGQCVPGCERGEEKIGVKTLLNLRLAPYLSQGTLSQQLFPGRDGKQTVSLHLRKHYTDHCLFSEQFALRRLRFVFAIILYLKSRARLATGSFHHLRRCD